MPKLNKIVTAGLKNARDSRNIPTNNESLLDVYDAALKNTLKLSDQGKEWENEFDSEIKKMKAERIKRAQEQEQAFLARSKLSRFRSVDKPAQSKQTSKNLEVVKLTDVPSKRSPYKGKFTVKIV